MCTIVLLTSEYPYGKGETYIESELEYVKHKMDKFYIVPLYRPDKNEKSRGIPKGISILRLPKRNKGRIYYRIKSAFCKPFLYGIKELYFQNKLNKCTINELYKFVYSAYVHKAVIKETLCKSGINPQETILYSYWMDSVSLSIAMLRKEYGYKMAITRAHGGDLYDERLPWKHQFLRKYITESLNYVFPISLQGKDYIDRRIGVHSNVIPMHLGIIDWGLSEFHKRSKITIVSCSNIVKLKRIDLIIDALEKLNFEFIWYHFGTGQEMQYIQEKAAAQLCKSKYEFMGNVPNREIRMFYKEHNIDMFLNVSETEGIPVSIMEAMSYGIPPIATDVGGVRELISDEYNGYLLPKDIVGEDIATAINKMVTLPEKMYLEMRKSARKTFTQYWNSENNFSVFYQLLECDL